MGKYDIKFTTNPYFSETVEYQTLKVSAKTNKQLNKVRNLLFKHHEATNLLFSMLKQENPDINIDELTNTACDNYLMDMSTVLGQNIT